jgi:hypothetical protein
MSKPANTQKAKLLSFFAAIFKNPYETLENPAKRIKALAQMLVGIFLIISVGAQLWAVAQRSHGINDFWYKFKEHLLLDTIADALLVATAIELAYMLFTDGPDEAINPPIIALAAAILFRIPGATALADEGLKRSLEIAAYGAVLAVLLWVRVRFFESEARRKELEAKIKENQ